MDEQTTNCDATGLSNTFHTLTISLTGQEEKLPDYMNPMRIWP